MKRLFVYGTLAPGQSNHSVLEDIPGIWETATLKGELFNEGWGAEFGCPGIVPAKDGQEVKGYVFSSDNLSEHWAMLDELEGSGYARVLVEARKENGEKIPAFVYALNQASRKI